MARVSAEVITRPGNLGDDTFSSLEIHVEGVRCPFHMVMALSRVSVKALSEQVDPDDLYAALARGINQARMDVSLVSTA